MVIAPLLLVLLVFGAISAWSSRSARTRLLTRLRTHWGEARDQRPDFEAIADFFRSHTPASALDDRTWDDLLLDNVFSYLDRTESRIGQQLLYHRLRSAPDPRFPDAFETLVSRLAGDDTLRENAQCALARLNDTSVYFVHRLARPDALDRQWWHILFPLWSAAIGVTLALAVLWPQLLILVALEVAVNLAVRIATARRIGGEIAWFRHVGPALSTAHELRTLANHETTAVSASFTSDLQALRRLGRIARWVSRDPLTTGEVAGALLEYLNLLLLMDANALYFAGQEMQTHAPAFLRVIQTIGDIDAAIAIASVRTSVTHWTRPRFVASGAPSLLSDLRHPLVEESVPNSIALAPPHGVLITGSNMSGKSTFLRTVGINVVLAQTINMCFATSYEAPVFRVRSCIGRSDDLLSGKSYYLVEVEAVLALVTASGREQPHLFIFDELFRGTNAVERIAAAEAVLEALIADGKPHVVLAATHDVELVDLLRHRYVVYHLGDRVGPEGLVFDYQLTPGPATSRNAIALLELHGAPQSLVTQALARAAALDAQRRHT